MVGDLLRYLGVLRGKWPLIVPAALALAAGLSAVTVVVGRKHPLVLSGPLWLLITVVCLSVAQFLAWRDSEAIPINPSHAEQLRAVAGQLQTASKDSPQTEPIYSDGKTSAPVLEAAFRAHFPNQVKLIDEWRTALEHIHARKRALEKATSEGALERFPADQGWDAGLIARTCIDRRMDLLSDPDWLATKYASPDYERIFGGDVECISAWVRQIFRSDVANEFRGALAEVAAPKARARHALEQIVRIQGAPMRRERSCPICSPS